MRFYKQYLDEIAPVPPSPRQAQRNQVLLRHFSLSRCLLCLTKMRQRGIQHHLKEHNKHKLLFQQTVRLSFAVWFIPRDLFQKDSGLFWDGVVGGGQANIVCWGSASVGCLHGNMCSKSISGSQGFCLKGKVTKGRRSASLFEEVKFIPFQQFAFARICHILIFF